MQVSYPFENYKGFKPTQNASNTFSVRRIGIYGGSFNPIHNGHVATADFLLDNKYVDEVRFLLNPKSPFKVKHKMPDPYFRGKMVRLATDSLRIKYDCQGNDLDTIEMMDNARGETCYTVGTLKRLIYSSMDDRFCHKEYVLIIGTDVFNSIKKFKSWKWFLETKLVKFIILPRGGYEIDVNLLREFDDLIIKVDYSNFKPIELSSSEIRENFGKGEYNIAKNKVNKKVFDYIIKNNLY